MRDFELPEPAAVWKIFEMICEIPHPSGQETALADALTALAKEHGLAVRRDAAGNLRIDRPAAAGFETAPRVILQGHLDMVPQAAESVTFDFATQAIPLTLRGGWISSCAGTTLGADNGIGVAIAMALLLDPELQCGALAGVFTVSEEVGLNGAQALSREFLDGDILFNLDSEEDIFYIGCAGGARQEIDIPAEFEPLPAGWKGVSLGFHNLAGGHSGSNIGDRRGNALKLLAGALAVLPEIRVAGISGGSLDNVIPREAAAYGALAPEFENACVDRLMEYAGAQASEFDMPPDFRISFRLTETPEKVWSRDFRERFIAALCAVPNGAFGEFEGVVRTSSNLAAVVCDGNRIKVRTSQRSLFDAERKEMSRKVGDAFAGLNGAATIDNSYPGWTPKPDSPVLARAKSVYQELFGRTPEVKVIHAGLECGIFCGIHPELDILSFGPTILDVHSPTERVNVESVAHFYSFLRKVLRAVR